MPSHLPSHLPTTQVSKEQVITLVITLAITLANGLGQQETAAFPAGTGDCAAIKLLHAAASAGLQPYSMVEFWYDG